MRAFRGDPGCRLTPNEQIELAVNALNCGQGELGGCLAATGEHIADKPLASTIDLAGNFHDYAIEVVGQARISDFDLPAREGSR